MLLWAAHWASGSPAVGKIYTRRIQADYGIFTDAEL